MFGAARDVTIEREAAAALTDTERRYRMLAENATDVVFSADTQ